MDPEKILAWFKTPEGSAFRDDVVKGAVAAKVKDKELYLPDQVKAQLDAARAEQRELAENQRKLEVAARDIHALDKTVPVGAIMEQLEAHEPGAVRDANIERMKSDAKLRKSRNAPAAGDDPALAGQTEAKTTHEAKVAKFEKMAAEGRFGTLRDAAHKAEMLKAYLQTQAA